MDGVLRNEVSPVEVPVHLPHSETPKRGTRNLSVVPAVVLSLNDKLWCEDASILVTASIVTYNQSASEVLKFAGRDVSRSTGTYDRTNGQTKTRLRMTSVMWLGCIFLALCLVRGVSARAARVPLDDAARIALDRLTMYLEDMGENAAQKRRSQYRPGVDFVNPISRLSTAGQIYSVKLRPENDYNQPRYDTDTSRPVGRRPVQAPHFTLLDYISDALQPTDNRVLDENALSANKRQPPSGFHAVRGRRSVYS